MKDFDIAKYLKEHQLGSYGILNHYMDLKPLKEDETTEGPKPLKLRSTKDLIYKFTDEDDTRWNSPNDKLAIGRMEKVFEEVISWVKRSLNKDIKIEKDKDGSYQIADISHFDEKEIKELENYLSHVGIDDLENKGGFNWRKKNERADIVSEDDQELEEMSSFDTWDPSMSPDDVNTQNYSKDMNDPVDRMMGISHKDLSKVGKIVSDTIRGLRQDGFDDEEILQFLARL